MTKFSIGQISLQQEDGVQTGSQLYSKSIPNRFKLDLGIWGQTVSSHEEGRGISPRARPVIVVTLNAKRPRHHASPPIIEVNLTLNAANLIVPLETLFSNPWW